eukprot:158134-Rhodomonas_salina.1
MDLEAFTALAGAVTSSSVGGKFAAVIAASMRCFAAGSSSWSRPWCVRWPYYRFGTPPTPI